MAGLEAASRRLPEEIRDVYDRRVESLRATLNVALITMVFLYFGAIATGIAWLARLVPGLDDVSTALRTVASALSGLSVLALLVFFILRRRIGQLEADLVALCISHR